MSTIKTIKNRSILSITCLVALHGCSWVDSAGEQTARGEDSEIFTPVLVAPVLATPDIVSLANKDPLTVIEQTAITARLDGLGNSLQNWQWEPVEQTEQRCDSVDGFDQRFAELSLVQACTDLALCNIEFNEYSEDDATHITINLPRLHSAVQLDYVLTAADADGTLITRNQTLCALSVNEAPDAGDDAYIALRDEVRISHADDPDSLLINDRDDLDSRNQALTVDPTPVEPPIHAAVFTLRSDGSFLYQAKEDIPVNENGRFEDRFTYAVTDGLHTVNATAVITVVDFNRAPQSTGTLDDVEMIIDDSEDQADAVLDLADYFADPDGDRLYFTVDQETVPSGLQAALSEDGILSLQADNNAAVGIWLVGVSASDGLENTSSDFYLRVDSLIYSDNQNPSATDITNRLVRGSFNYDVSVFFSDPDGDELTYSASGLPAGVSIDRDGLIRGTQNNSNTGAWFVTVTADDGHGATVSDSFRLTIR